jgi:hypothetical protein
MGPRPKSLRAVLDANNDVAALLRQAKEQQRLTARLREMLPPDLAGRLHSARLRGACLVLFAESPAWASRLRFAAPRLQAMLPGVRATRIKTLPPEEEVGRRKTSRHPAVTPLGPQAADHLRTAAAAVSDPELRLALEHLAARSEGAGQTQSLE